MRGQKSGGDHPNFKHGKYVGAKKRLRKTTPRTGITKLVRQWLATRQQPFVNDDVKNCLPKIFSSRQVSYCLHNLKRAGLLRELDHVGNQNKVWEVIK